MAVSLASFFLWEIPSFSYVKAMAIMATAGEVLFQIQWYHIREADSEKKLQLLFGIILGGSFFLGHSGEGISLSLLIYLVFFQRSIAERVWKKTKN
ncbi:MAG: hypothetical protein CO139_00440 [Candidatus Moranbacteria bacterium CG_4_9_14_3_um_filter_36_9]|nr:MAG: hypothetical protein CO139_00440 [Candidatus Moranbacteria bacterium CG_4_9_14_3_um_filter_36_9]